MKKSFIHQQEEISFVKTTFTQYLKDKLEVVEVQGPILSKVGDGMQDNLSGVENPVSVKAVSYTHLDVYKRQGFTSSITPNKANYTPSLNRKTNILNSSNRYLITFQKSLDKWES